MFFSLYIYIHRQWNRKWDAPHRVVPVARWITSWHEACNMAACGVSHSYACMAFWITPFNFQKNVSWTFFKVTAIFKDLSMTHRTLWDQRHEDQSVHEAHSAECTDVSEWPLSASDLWHELYGFDTLRSRNLLAKFWSGRWRIMHCRKSMHGFVGHVFFVQSYMWMLCLEDIKPGFTVCWPPRIMSMIPESIIKIVKVMRDRR